MKIAVFLSALFCSALTAPNPPEVEIHPPGPAFSYPGPTQISNPAPAVAMAKVAAGPAGPSKPIAKNAPAASGAAAVGGAAVAGANKKAAAGDSGAAHFVAIVRDDRVDDKSGTYSFDVAGEDGVARQESGAPLPEGGIKQTGSYKYTQPDGTTFELKYIADENGFQPESSNLPALPQFVQDQIAFAKNNPEPEAAAAGAKAGAVAGAKATAAAGAGAGVAPPALAAPGSGYLSPGRR